MSAVHPPAPAYSDEPFRDPHRWILAVLAAIFILVGVGVMLSIATAGHPFVINMPGMMYAGSVWGWVVGALVFAGFLLIALAIVRRLVWGADDWHRERRYYRHYARWGNDPAMNVARERYARGEISREQFEEIAGHLERHDYRSYP